MSTRPIIYSIVAALIVGILPTFAASSSKAPSYTPLLEFDRDQYYTGETAFFNVLLLKGQESVDLDTLEIEAVLRHENKAVSLRKRSGYGMFSCTLNEGKSTVEVTIYRKDRHEQTSALQGQQEKFRSDLTRLQNSRRLLFWKRNKIDQTIRRLEAMAAKIEAAIRQLNTPLAKISQNIVVVNKPVLITTELPPVEQPKETPETKEPEEIAAADIETESVITESAPVPESNYEEPKPELQKEEKIPSPKLSSLKEPEKTAKSSSGGSNIVPPKEPEPSSAAVQKNVTAETPPASIPPFYSKKEDLIAPVTSSDYKKDGIVTGEDVRIILNAGDNSSGVAETLYRIDGGNWTSYQRPLADFADGDHVVEFYSIDKKGNKEDPAQTLRVSLDRTPPGLNISYPASTEENTAIISGTVSEDTVALTMDGQQIPLENGAFAIGHVALPTRRNAFTLTAIDHAGNKASRQILIECLWDKTSPAIVIKGIEEGVFYPKVVTPLVKVEDTQSNVKTSLTLNGESFSSGTLIPRDGKYTLNVEAVDSYENPAGASVSFGIDRSAPETRDNYKKADIWSKEDAKITLVATDAGSGIETVYYRIGRGAFTAYQTPLEIHEEGLHKIQYYAQDKLGNKESPKTMTVKLDKTAPVIEAAAELTVEATDLLTPMDLPAPVVKDNLDQPVQMHAQQVSQEGYPLGTTQILYEAEDQAGNSASTTTRLEVRDTVPPHITLYSPKDNSYAAHTVDVSGRVWEIFLKQLFINGEEISVTDRQFTKTIPVTDDHFLIDVRAVDTSGNEGGESRTVLRDIVAPRTEHNYAHGGIWSEENAGITLSATDAGSGVDATYYRQDEDAFAEYRRPLEIRKEGKFKIEFYSIDKVGNEEEHRHISVLIDRTPPVVKITSPQNGVYVSGDTLEVRGTVTEAFLSRVVVNGQLATVADGSFAATVPLMQDKTVLTAEAFDEADHRASDTISVLRDATLPVTTDDYAFDGVWVSQDAVILLTAVDTDSGIAATYYRIYAPATTPPAFLLYNPGSSITVNQEGKWIVEYYSVDRMGSRETPYLISVLLDKTAPVSADNHAGHISPTNQDVAIVLTASDTPSSVAAIYARLDQADFAVVSEPIIVSQDGTHVLEYYALDKAGNEEVHHTLTITVDKTPSQITVETPANGSTIEANTVTIKGTVSSDTVTLTLNGQNVALVNSAFSVNDFKLTLGENKLTFEAKDAVDNRTSLELTVTKVNRPPVLNPLVDVTVEEGQTVSFNPTGSDPDRDSITFSYSGWMTSPSYRTDYDDAGQHRVTVTISDGQLTDSQEVTITVNNVNRAPVLDPIADKTVYADETVTFQPTASDPDGDALLFTYSGWMSSSSYTTTANDGGSHTVTVSVSDGKDTDSQEVTVTVEVCGDGIKNGNEVCDEGTQNGQPDKCNSQCSGITSAVCGNNVLEAGEVCEGNSIRSCVADGYNGVQFCTANCTYEACVLSEYCGDGVMQTAAGEACDDGNTTSGDGCSLSCKIEFCGDGIVQTGLGEECDDGNTVAGDGCNATCKDEYCGDGVVQPDAGEVCDSNSRSCTASSGYPGTETCGVRCIGFNTCTTDLFCGDGVCTNPPETTTNCPSDCPAVCGNGVAEPTEECDDGNTVSEDGCSGDCTLEYCGDGFVQSTLGEECDDGNTLIGDGCGATCLQEQLADTTAPSVPTGLASTAYDSAGNVSVQSNPTSASTQAQTTNCSQANILCVDDTGGATQEYSTIQAAVDAAVAGDAVLVYPGTYNESVLIPDGKQGAATNPITIKALYPARKPLDGGTWADTANKRSVVNAGSGVGAFYNEGSYTTTPSQWVRYIIIDGFYITGGGGLSLYSSGGGIFFENDDNIWIRNNVIINSSPYYLYNINGEQTGNVYLKFTDNSLVQNNYFEYTNTATVTSAFFVNNSGSNNIVEYNEGYIGTGAVAGSFAYVRVGSNPFMFRYNYLKADATNANNIISRFRDDINYTFINNYYRSTTAQQFFIVHEQPEACCLVEQHQFNQNTFYYDLGSASNRRVLGFGNLDNSTANNNIFYSGIYDADSYPVGQAYTTNSNSITLDSNIYFNYSALVQPVFTGYTETNTQNINPNINPATGCASSVDNGIYGANLDVSNVPYRKCDGAFYAAAGKFGINVTVSDGGTPPSDTTPPTVSLTSPTNGSTVSGSISVSASASDNVGVAGVQFRLDGVNLGLEDTTSPYFITWNTTQTTNGSHILTAVARDAAGNQTTSANISVTVNNVSDTQAPSIPSNLTATSISSSQINLSWSASTDNVGVTGYSVYRNGSQVSNVTGQLSYQDTGLSSSISYFYTVSAYDAAGNNSAQSTSASATTQSAPTGNCSQTNILCVDDTPGSTQEYSTIQTAVDVAQAGDTILIYAGTYTNSCVIGSCGGGNNYSADASRRANIKLKSSGTSANPITIKSAGDGEVIIDAGGTVEYNIYGVSYQYWIIDGITLKDALRTSLFWQGNSSLDLTVKNSSFQGTASAPNYGYGISVNNSGDAANNNTIILNNTFSLPGAFVVIDITSSYNSLISGNTITGGDYGIYLHNYTYGSIIEKNTLTGNTGDLTGIFIRDDDNFIIRYNLIKGNYGTQHILYQDSSGIGSTGVKILNNTIDCGTTSSTGIKESDTWAETTNNILYNCFVDIRGINPANLPSGQPGYNILYDIPGRYITSYRYYYGTGDQWSVVSGNNLTSNPFFVLSGNDYNLQSGSPAVNAGDPAATAGVDLIGTIVPKGGRADIGAFEYIL